ncbi:MAG: hypothetical protein HFG79_09815 [Lachnospiraceae bacterium]|nr:hypothetical protein [Lachnospiraceae bacterium]
MKKIFHYLMKPIIFVSAIYLLTFLLCKYWNYVEDSHIYILTYSREDGYGITDDGQLIDWSHIRCFEGPYARTSYNSIDQIKCEDIIIISLNHPFQVDKLYVVYPEMRVFVIYNNFIFQMEYYDQIIYNLLSDIWIKKDKGEH